MYPYTVHLLHVYTRPVNLDAIPDHISVRPPYTIGDKQCRGTLFVPYNNYRGQTVQYYYREQTVYPYTVCPL
jgi:hypothetical protein